MKKFFKIAIIASAAMSVGVFVGVNVKKYLKKALNKVEAIDGEPCDHENCDCEECQCNENVSEDSRKTLKDFYSAMTVKELRKEASALNISGARKMKKAELVEAIVDIETEYDDDREDCV